MRDEHLNHDNKTRIDLFNERLTQRLDDSNHLLADDVRESLHLQEDIDYDDNPGVISNPGIAPADREYGDMMIEDERPEDDDEEVIDKFINADLNMDVGSGNERRGRVVKRSRGHDGAPIGRAHANPLFDTRQYDVVFTDGSTKQCTAIIIAENMFAQVNDEGRQFQLLKEIVDHKKDSTAIPISAGTVTAHNGVTKPRITTKGWYLLCEWKDGSSSWEKLNELKASNPIEVAEYAVTKRIVDEPAFNWWVPFTIRKRNRIISKVKSKYWKTSHKFGIRLPHSVEEALQIDVETGTDFWTKALNNDMNKSKGSLENTR